MSRARIMLLVIALVAGGLAAFLATRGNAPQTETIEVTKIKQEAKAKVLVANQAIGVGERLTPQSVAWQDWPEGAVRPEYVTIALVPEAPTALAGAVARFEFFPGEPIREAKLARADQGYLSAVIDPGMRGVSIAVTTTSAAGGFIVPNDRVDVILTRRAKDGDQSETIMRNVKVLALGKRLGEQGETGGVDETDPKAQMFEKESIATLELTPRQAEALVNATELGKLALALRSVADFGEIIDPNKGVGNGSTIRMVRFGKLVTTTTGGPGEQSLESAVDQVAEAAATPPGLKLAPAMHDDDHTHQDSPTPVPSGPLPKLPEVQ